MRVVESFAPNRCAATPAKILLRFPQKCGHRCIPRRSQAAGQQISSGCARKYPTVRGGGANAGVLKRSNEFREPSTRETHVGIGEDENFEFFGQRLYRAAQVEHFLATILRWPGDRS